VWLPGGAASSPRCLPGAGRCPGDFRTSHPPLDHEDGGRLRSARGRRGSPSSETSLWEWASRPAELGERPPSPEDETRNSPPRKLPLPRREGAVGGGRGRSGGTGLLLGQDDPPVRLCHISAHGDWAGDGLRVHVCTPYKSCNSGLSPRTLWPNVSSLTVLRLSGSQSIRGNRRDSLGYFAPSPREILLFRDQGARTGLGPLPSLASQAVSAVRAETREKTRGTEARPTARRPRRHGGCGRGLCPPRRFEDAGHGGPAHSAEAPPTARRPCPH
jgi:hypothetical protein